MEIRAAVRSAGDDHRATVATGGRASALPLAARAGGGSSVSGGELLCLALATCYCNDVYREAAQAGIAVRAVEVEVAAEFGGPGEPARRITYSAHVDADAGADEVEALLRHTDAVAEVHATLRGGIAVERRPHAAMEAR